MTTTNPIVDQPLPSSVEVSEEVLEWVDAAVKHGVAVRVLEAETGHGKTYVAQSLFDKLVKRTESRYWTAGLVPPWPQKNESEIDQARKTVIPTDEMRNADPGNRLGFAWIGLPLGEIDGAGRINNTAQFIEQLVRINNDVVAMHAAKIQANVKRTTAWATVRRIVKLILGFVLPGVVSEVFSGGETIRGTWKEWQRALRDPSEDRRLAARDALLAVLAEIRDQALDVGGPLVIVLDDAHAAPADVLDVVGLLTGLTLADPEDGRGWDQSATQKGGDLSEEAKWRPPSHEVPILIVATTWKGESHRRTEGLFDQWVATSTALLEGREGAVEVIRLRPIPEEHVLQETVKYGVPLPASEKMVKHLGRPYEGGGVNALVWVVALARVATNLSGGPLTRGLDIDVIENLPTAPTFHTKERLDKLKRTEPDGQLAHDLLTQLAEWGARVPRALAVDLAGEPPKFDPDPSLRLLEAWGMVELPEADDPLSLVRIQVDLQAFIAENNEYDIPVCGVARQTRNRILELLRDELDHPDTMLDMSQVRLIVLRAAELDTTAPKFDDIHDALAWYFGAPSCIPNPSVTDTREMLRLVASWGKSRVAGRAAIRLADLYDDRDKKIEILTPLASNPSVAFRLADLYDDRDKKIEILTPFKAEEHVAIRLADLYDDRDKKIEILTPLASNRSVAFRLADLYDDRDKKIEILTPLKADEQVAIRLADLYDDRDKKIEILTPFASTRSVAFRLADLYDDLNDKISVLDGAELIDDLVLIKLSRLLLGSLPAEINSKDLRLDSLLPTAQGDKRSGSVRVCLFAGMQAACLLHNGENYESTSNVPNFVNTLSHTERLAFRRIWAMGFSAATMRFGADIAPAWKQVFSYHHQEPWHFPVLATTFASNVAFNIGEHPTRKKLAHVARGVFKFPRKNIKHIANFVEAWSMSGFRSDVLGIDSDEVLSAVAFARSCVGTSRNQKLDRAEQILAEGRLCGWQNATDFGWKTLCPELIAKISGT